MEKQKEFDRTSDACLDCIHMLAVIDGANWMITDVAHKYADFLTEDDKKKLDEVKRDLKECTHKTNSALEGIFSKLSTFIQPAASKPKYESFIIPRELIDYENDKKILLHIPDEMEYGGYSQKDLIKQIACYCDVHPVHFLTVQSFRLLREFSFNLSGGDLLQDAQHYFIVKIKLDPFCRRL